jgi:hypothetical protein
VSSVSGGSRIIEGMPAKHGFKKPVIGGEEVVHEKKQQGGRDEQGHSWPKPAVWSSARPRSTKKDAIANAENNLSSKTATPESSAAIQAEDRCPWDFDGF